MDPQPQSGHNRAVRGPCIRNFTIASVTLVLVSCFILFGVVHRMLVNQLVQSGEQVNIQLSSHLQSVLAGEISRQPDLAAFNRPGLDGPVLVIRAYGVDGSLLFMAGSAMQAASPPAGAVVEQVLAGAVVTRMLGNAGQSKSSVRVLRTLMPWSPTGLSADAAVILIDRDISAAFQHAIALRDRIVFGAGVAMLLLVALTLIFVRNAVRQGNDADLVQANAGQMIHLACNDALTGLPNRELFRIRLQSAVARAERNNKLLAVMLLDLDRFKQVNDSLGRLGGDQLLKEVAQRLHGCVRLSDTIARQGGDEFSILLDAVTHVDEIEEVARRILEQMSAGFRISGREIFISASIGITVYPVDDRDIDDAMEHADLAMYAAKDAGRNQYVFYSTSLNKTSTEKLAMEQRLQQALEDDEYQLYFQPIIDLRKASVMGVEALLRWNNPEYGIVSPDKFIPLLEETGYICMVGDWVLRTACCKAVEWQRLGFAPMTMSVNISMIQFRRLQFVDSVRQALEVSGLDPRYLKLELTESMLMDQTDASVQKLEAVRALGVSVAADDFGTGYSSLSYLKKLPIDLLKIDRSFVMDVHKSSDSAAIVTAIAALGHSLRLGIIAEGVECVEELNFLSALSCSFVQGYFFSKPLDEHSLLEVLGDADYFRNRMEIARQYNESKMA